MPKKEHQKRRGGKKDDEAARRLGPKTAVAGVMELVQPTTRPRQTGRALQGTRPGRGATRLRRRGRRLRVREGGEEEA